MPFAKFTGYERKIGFLLIEIFRTLLNQQNYTTMVRPAINLRIVNGGETLHVSHLHDAWCGLLVTERIARAPGSALWGDVAFRLIGRRRQCSGHPAIFAAP